MKQILGFKKKLWTRLAKSYPNWKKRNKTQINKISDEKGDITTHTSEILKIIR